MRDINLKVFSERFNTLLKENNLNQSKFSRATEGLNNKRISLRTINYWATGEKAPNEESLTILSEYFKVSIEWLTGEEDFRTVEEYQQFIMKNVEQHRLLKGALVKNIESLLGKKLDYFHDYSEDSDISEEELSMIEDYQDTYQWEHDLNEFTLALISKADRLNGYYKQMKEIRGYEEELNHREENGTSKRKTKD